MTVEFFVSKKSVGICLTKFGHTISINCIECRNALKSMKVSHLGLEKHIKCIQILGHVADQNYIEFID